MHITKLIVIKTWLYLTLNWRTFRISIESNSHMLTGQTRLDKMSLNAMFRHTRLSPLKNQKLIKMTS